jgi:hypothetical protein
MTALCRPSRTGLQLLLRTEVKEVLTLLGKSRWPISNARDMCLTKDTDSVFGFRTLFASLLLRTFSS